MKKLKYLLLAGCASMAVNTEAAYQINNGALVTDGTPYVTNEANLTDLKAVGHSITFTNANLNVSGNIAASTGSKLIFGQDGQDNTYTFHGSTWNSNNADIEFRGNTTIEVNSSDNGKVLFGSVGGSVTKSTGSTVRWFVQDGTLPTEADTLTLYVTGADILSDNSLYHRIKSGTGTYAYQISRKTVEEIMAEGFTQDQANLLTQMMSQSGIYDNLTHEAQQGNTTAVKNALSGMLNPTQASNTAALNIAKENANVAVARMSGIAGGEEAEDVINLIPWVQGMFNHTRNTQDEGFKANTKGIALGIDAEINNAWMVGIGYSNVNSRIKTNAYSTRGYGDNGFIYGQYKPSNWYARGMAGFGRTTYKDRNTNAKWKVDAYTANGSVGYIWSILDTSLGLRYTYLDNKPYTSNGAEIAVKDTDNLTAVLDFKVSQEYAAKNWLVTPSAHLGFTQDIISAESVSNINLGAGYGSYQVNGNRLHKTGVETGAGVVLKNGNCEFHVNYEGAFRQDNYSNAGLVKFKYNF